MNLETTFILGYINVIRKVYFSIISIKQTVKLI